MHIIPNVSCIWLDMSRCVVCHSSLTLFQYVDVIFGVLLVRRCFFTLILEPRLCNTIYELRMNCIHGARPCYRADKRDDVVSNDSSRMIFPHRFQHAVFWYNLFQIDLAPFSPSISSSSLIRSIIFPYCGYIPVVEYGAI